MTARERIHARFHGHCPILTWEEAGHTQACNEATRQEELGDAIRAEVLRDVAKALRESSKGGWYPSRFAEALEKAASE